MTDIFDPAVAGCWMARGRPAHHAHAIAEAWRCFPDLPNDAPLDARMARTRERVQMLRPLHEAISLETELQRRAANFAFVERQIAQGSTDSRYAAILHARDVHGHDWDAACAYADGHYAARAGWVSRPPSSLLSGQPDERCLAYEQGFQDGGGQPDDIFDVARRSFAVTRPEPVQTDSPQLARPLPSQWPSPTDVPPPVSWHRRLLLLGASELAEGTIGILTMLRERPGHESTTLLAIGRESGLQSLSIPTGPAAIDGVALRQQLRRGDYADILVDRKSVV